MVGRLLVTGVDADGLWDQPGNWLDDQGVNRVPGAADDVVIDRPAGDYTVPFRPPAGTARWYHHAALVPWSSGLTVSAPPTT